MVGGEHPVLHFREGKSEEDRSGVLTSCVSSAISLFDGVQLDFYSFQLDIKYSSVLHPS